jgi:hypothetical protein
MPPVAVSEPRPVTLAGPPLRGTRASCPGSQSLAAVPEPHCFGADVPEPTPAPATDLCPVTTSGRLRASAADERFATKAIVPARSPGRPRCTPSTHSGPCMSLLLPTPRGHDLGPVVARNRDCCRTTSATRPSRGSMPALSSKQMRGTETLDARGVRAQCRRRTLPAPPSSPTQSRASRRPVGESDGARLVRSDASSWANSQVNCCSGCAGPSSRTSGWAARGGDRERQAAEALARSGGWEGECDPGVAVSAAHFRHLA